MVGNIFAQGMGAFDAGYDRMNVVRQDQARRSAGKSLQQGDLMGASHAFGGAGMVDEQLQLQGAQRTQDAEAVKRKADGLLKVAQGLKVVPAGQRKATLTQLAPMFQQLDIDPQPFMALDEGQLTDAQLDAFSASLGKAAEEYTLAPGAVRYRGDRVLANNPTEPKHDWRELKRPDSSTYFKDFAAVGAPPPSAAGSRSASAGPASATAPQTDDVFGALVAQESGGRRGVLGPQTRYGRAEGMTQMLPATAQGMAQKLGIAWRPDLMRGTTDDAAQYQQQLGRAYFEEGLQKYGGDVQKALMYYHGGPDERLWGPKTQAYAKAVMARTQPYQVASNGSTPPPPGGNTIEGSAAPAKPKVPPSAGLTDLGNGFYRDAVGRTYQPDNSGKLVQTVGVTDGAVAKATEDVTQLNTALAATMEYEQAVRALSPTDFGPGGKYLGDPAKFARAQAAATQLMMLTKSPAMFNLGVITGPDMEILGGVIEDPSRWGALIRQNKIVPKLHSLAGGIGTRYTMITNGFKAQGGDPNGLPQLYGAQRQNGRWVVPGAKAAGGARNGKPGDRPPLSDFQR